MTEPADNKIYKAIDSASELYNRLVLLVGESGTGKTKALRRVADRLGVSVVNVNLILSGELLELTTEQRVLQLPQRFDQIVRQSDEPVMLDNLELLFGSDLKQNPLKLLQSLSRNKTVVATWNGALTENRLKYAEIGHPECGIYDTADTLIIDMNTMTRAETASH